MEIPFLKGVARQRGPGFGAFSQILGSTAIPYLSKYIIPAAKRVGADFLELAAPNHSEVVSGRKNSKAAAKSEGRQILRKQLGCGSKKKTPSRSIPTKSAKQTSRSRRDNFADISH